MNQPNDRDESAPEEGRDLPTTPRRRTYFVLEVDRFGDRMSRFVDKALVLLIVANVLAAVLQTVDAYYAAAPWLFQGLEAVSIVVFGLEYVLRLWSCVEDPAYRGALAGRLRFARTPIMLIDLAVLVLPTWFDLRPLRVLRLLRLGRYSPRLRMLGNVVRDKRDELFVGLFVAVVLLVASSTAMYQIEGGEGGQFQSIPHTMWWGVATLTTVGYGDVYPVTDLGRALGSIVALLGVGVFALPAGILASGFSEALEAQRGSGDGSHPGTEGATNASKRACGGTCPHCGASL
ncbi:MAG: ion transporter [Planctomycetota bacterium]